MATGRNPLDNLPRTADPRGVSVSLEQSIVILVRRPYALLATIPILANEEHYKILKLLEADPTLSQRRLAKELGVSLGKINYCLNALINKGWVKARNFKKNPNKTAYAYILTPHGMEQKAKAAARFLKRKLREYEQLKKEIDQLQCEVAEGRGQPE